MKVLRHGNRGDEVRKLQAATNRRLRSRHLAHLVVKEDGKLGMKTLDAVAKAAWALGALMATVDSIEDDREVTIGVQRMIRYPGRRNDQQRQRGKIRIANMLKQRKKRAEAKKKEEREQGGSSRSKAVNAFLAQVGTRERPPGSNGGGHISVMQTYWGFGRVPWCGIAAGYYAKRFGGVKGLRSDVASVQAITNHSRARHSPYGRFQDGPGGALPGSFVVIGGPGVHVAMLVEALRNGSAKTVEGNTSFGRSGSQSNGGCVAARVRSPQEIYGVATMNYPG